MTVAASSPTSHANAGGGIKVETSLALLGLDALALRVIGNLEDAGILTLLLKGPVTGWWLYDRPTDHVYRDIDLLVAPRDFTRAGQAMAAMGFTDYHSSVLGIYRPSHEQAWLSSVGSVDLHMSVAGIPARARARAWRLISRDAETYQLHGHGVRVAGETARSLFLALHAANHGSGEKARQDLRRGVEVIPREIWEQAAALAREIDAVPCLTAGLLRAPEGQALARDLGIADIHNLYGNLSWSGAFPEAFALAELLETPKRWWWAEVRGWGSATRLPSRAELYRRRLRVIGRLPIAFRQLYDASRSGAPVPSTDQGR